MRYMQPEGRITISETSLHRRMNKICDSSMWTQQCNNKAQHCQ